MEETIKLFSALSDETRLKIYLLLQESELCVCELAGILNMEQSRISHGLRVLREADLVDSRRDGKWIIYFLNPEIDENKIMQGIKSELKLPDSYLKKITRCKEESVRGECAGGQRRDR